MKREFFVVSLCLLCSVFTTFSQSWDDASKGKWTAEFKEVDIKSSADGTTQKAMLYRSTKGAGQPLIVSLHTWSGNYTQTNPLTMEILIRDYNFIQPDFRGPNNRPEACGSDLVIADIEDAIAYAIEKTDADKSQVHIVGASGGGYASFLCYMKLQYPVRSFSAWMPISDLEAWYWESVGRRQRYSDDILKSTSPDGTPDFVEMRKRSPLHLPYPAHRKGSSLYIYTGIHDGYTGSVPVTHSINMYNKIVYEKYPADKHNFVPQEDVVKMLAMRVFPGAPQATVGNRHIHYHKRTGDVELTIFEGTHEQLTDQAIGLIPVNKPVRTDRITLLTLGDSNAALKYGWALQLGMIYPHATVINRSISGKCVGISNLNSDKLNSLLTIDTTLQKINDRTDCIIIGLGTNDAKREHAARVKEFPANMRSLIQKVKNSELYRRDKPQLIILACPPLDETVADAVKYGGASKRLETFNRELVGIAKREGATFIDTHVPFSLLPQGTPVTSDGVHLTPQTARIVAEEIAKAISLQPSRSPFLSQ
ncbi:MAG: GDSL-type esterase/lipase family protein [Bacteroidales bacterium]|jgi:lysophospholipase L1-like esterase|nr:GDSL-type esterase/lipase family protein [Bacteroidales bacterium]